MREIKFRAWDTTAKSMYDISDLEDYPLNYLSNGDTDYTKFMQYTGLKDKNDVDIFEGDIVRVCKCEDDDLLSLDEVVQLPCGLWYLNTKENNSIYDIVNYEDKYVEVIGNIYENPELLK